MFLIDKREPKWIKNLLSSLGHVETIKLDVGDIIVGKYVIERKTLQDFYNSLIDGRLFQQLKQLANVDGYPLILLEWRRVDDKHLKVVWGGLKACVKFRVPVVVVHDLEEEKNFFRSLMKEKGRIRIPKRKRLEDERLMVLTGFRGIGEKKARLILKSHSLREFFNLGLEELKMLLGEKLGYRIYKLINKKSGD